MGELASTHNLGLQNYLNTCLTRTKVLLSFGRDLYEILGEFLAAEIFIYLAEISP